MLFNVYSKKFALVAVLAIIQCASPALAQGLGQSGWTTPGQGASSNAGLAQSGWTAGGQSASSNSGLGQSARTTGQGAGGQNTGAFSGQLGQSAWAAPGQSRGQIQGNAQGMPNLGQSAWNAPGQQSMQAQRQATSQVNTGLSPNDWVSANRAMATKARDQHAQRMNQAGRFGQSEMISAATMTPTRAAQEPSADLSDGVGQVDIVGDSAAFQANPYGNGNMNSAGNYIGTGPGTIQPVGTNLQGSVSYGEPVGEAVGEPVGEPVSGAGASMQEMMAGIMAVPMMMAANAGLLGQGFGRPMGGGFRSYSGGGVAVTPKTMGIGIAGYSIGRVANRLGNQLARQAMRNVGR